MHPMPVDWWWPPQARTILLVELLAVAGLAGSCLRRRLPVGAVALAVLGLLMTLNTHRFRAAWSILMIPWVVDVLRPRLPWVEGRRSAAVALLLLVAVLCSEGRDWGGPDLGLDPVWVPTELGDAVLELGIEGPIFNDYDAGGFLGWTLYGRARVFIDGRTPPFFTDDHFYAARAALADGAVFDRLAAGYGFRAAIVPSRSPLCEHLGEDPDWTGVWRGGLRSRTIFLPRSAATRPELPEPCAQAEK